jgi:hypothetical protein
MGTIIDAYSQATGTGNKFQIQKGQLNKLKLRPQILNEHAESSREIMDVVESGVIVGQIFKASQDNINGIALTLESAEGASVDDFESYADDAAIRTAWPKTGTNEVSLETTIIKEGTQAMSLLLTTLNDEWAKATTGSVDYTGYNFDFFYQQNRSFADTKLSFFIEDGSANTASIQLAITDIGTWTHFEINVAALSDDGAATDLTDIDKIGFRVDDVHPLGIGYVDDMFAVPPPGTIELKLWDMGVTLPVGDGATFSLDDATQYTEIGDRGLNGGSVSASCTLNLLGGKRFYQINKFAAGPALEIPDNTLLTVDHYYAITLHYVDTDVNVYGPDTSYETNYYKNGYAFNTAGEAAGNHITKIAGAVGSGAYSDLMFMVLSTQDVFVVDIGQVADAAPGADSSVLMLTEDKDMKVTSIAVSGVQAQQITAVDLTLRPVLMEKGAKIEIYYSDDFTDSVAVINFGFRYYFVPQEANG